VQRDGRAREYRYQLHSSAEPTSSGSERTPVSPQGVRTKLNAEGKRRTDVVIAVLRNADKPLRRDEIVERVQYVDPTITTQYLAPLLCRTRQRSGYRQIAWLQPKPGLYLYTLAGRDFPLHAIDAAVQEAMSAESAREVTPV
jgi:hypothetical protein